MVQVVETVTADSLAALRALRDRETPADLVELRLDGVRDLDVAGALAGRRRPVIVTCRPAWEGGRFDGSEEERVAVLARAAELGAEYVDIEWKADPRALARCRDLAQVILSHHDFSGVPADLASRVRAMRESNAAVVKIVVTAADLSDCLVLKQAVADDAGAHVAIAMGPRGRLTRVWPAWFGSRWTYGGSAAPGQIGTQELVDCYRVRQTTAATRAYGVAGAPLGHSASPAMHNAAFAALGLDAVYLPLETDAPADLFGVADAVGLAGASVTIPLKRALLPSVRADDLVQRIGALNTLRRGADGWEGRNFDVAGLLAPLEARGVALRGRQAVVLGAGGAARAAVAALEAAGADVRIAARRPQAARALAAELGAQVDRWPPRSDWDLLVNTTPVGMWPCVEASPVAADDDVWRSARGKVVYDLIYNPPETRLLQLAGAAGAQPIGGLEMLVAQACRQFEWWTGQSAPRQVMAAAARRFVTASRPPLEGRAGSGT